MSEIDVDALRVVAEDASPGPWVSERSKYVAGRYVHIDEPNGMTIRHAVCTPANDAEFIAAFDPPTVLALLDRLQAAEGAVERARALINWRVGRTTTGVDRMIPASDLIAALDRSEK